MQATDQTSYINHEDPARRPDRAYMAMVDLAPFGSPDTCEQLWLKPLDGGEYEVCCIPFRAYGIALGDRVGLGDRDYVDRVVHGSGRRVLRILFIDPRPQPGGPDLRQAFIAAVKEAGLLREWNGERHVAVDVPPDAEMQAVYDSVAPGIQNGTAVWEWADAEPFRTDVPSA